MFMLACALAVASLPETMEWSPQLSHRMQKLLDAQGLAFWVSILFYLSAIPCGFFSVMHHDVATAAWALQTALVGYYQGDLLEVLFGEARAQPPHLFPPTGLAL